MMVKSYIFQGDKYTLLCPISDNVVQIKYEDTIITSVPLTPSIALCLAFTKDKEELDTIAKNLLTEENQQQCSPNNN